jgi:hypothetical protein
MAATKQKANPFLSQDVRDVGTLHFADPAEIVEWLKVEQTYWKWAERNVHAETGFLNFERHGQFFATLSNALSNFQQFTANRNDGGSLENARNHLNLYATSGLASKTPRARLITSLKENDPNGGEYMAQGALSAFLNEAAAKSDSGVPVQYRYLVRRGIAAMMDFDNGINPKDARIATSAFAEIAADNKQLMADLLAANQTSLAALTSTRDDIIKQQGATSADHAARLEKIIEEFKRRARRHHQAPRRGSRTVHHRDGA